MTYLSDRQIVQCLVPVRLLLSVVHYGVADRQSPEAVQLTAWLKSAELGVLAGRHEKEQAKLARRSWAIYDAVMAPFLASETDCAKFGLVVFYLLAELEEQGIHTFAAGSDFDLAQQALYGPEGSIVALANVPDVDASAQKQARRLMRHLQAEGYFREAIAA